MGNTLTKENQNTVSYVGVAAGGAVAGLLIGTGIGACVVGVLGAAAITAAGYTAVGIIGAGAATAHWSCMGVLGKIHTPQFSWLNQLIL